MIYSFPKWVRNAQLMMMNTEKKYVLIILCGWKVCYRESAQQILILKQNNELGDISSPFISSSIFMRWSVNIGHPKWEVNPLQMFSNAKGSLKRNTSLLWTRCDKRSWCLYSMFLYKAFNLVIIFFYWTFCSLTISHTCINQLYSLCGQCSF